MSDYLVIAEGGPGLIQVLATPAALPARCAVCGFAGGLKSDGSKDPRVFIDFKFTLDYYGAVIFCSDCMVNVANAIGYASAEQAEAMRVQISEQQSELLTLREQNDKLRNAVATLVGSGNDPLVLESVASVEITDDGTREGDEDSESGSLNSALAELSAIEPIDEPRSDDLPGPTGSFGPSGLLNL